MLHFISESDIVGKSLFGILVIMSVVSWYLIFVKSFMNMRVQLRSNKFLREFWAASSLEQVETEIATHGANEPFEHLDNHALHPSKHHPKFSALKPTEKNYTNP